MIKIIKSTNKNLLYRKFSNYLRFKGEYNDIYINSNQIKYIQKCKKKLNENIFISDKDQIIKIPKYNNYYKIYMQDDIHFTVFKDNINYNQIEYFLKSNN